MVEAVTSTTVLVAAGAALATLLLVSIALFVRSRRSQPAGGQELVLLVSEMNTRMESMIRELSESLERAQEEGRRNRYLTELAGSIDLDEVLSRTLEAAGALPGVDAGLVSISTDDDKPIVATLGLSTEEAHRQVITGPPDGHEARAISLVYQYPPGADAGTDLVHSGLAVPVPGETGPIGFLSVYSRSPEHRYAEDEIRELEELSQRAGPAIENARSFREAKQLADLDDLKAINDRIGHLAGDAVLAETAERVKDVVRSADVACRVGGDEFSVILPESTTGDADQLYHRLLGAVSSRPVGQAGRLSISAGMAELREDDNPTAFFERADEALYRAKERGKGQVVSHEAPLEPAEPPDEEETPVTNA